MLSRALTVGKPFGVQEVLAKSLNILTANPILFVPSVVALLFSLLWDLALPSISAALVLVEVVVAGALVIILIGGFPPMVKAAVDGDRVSLTEAARRAYHRFWSLFAAGILVTIVVGLASLALLVPGIILGTWYAYTIPAIMLEDKGALDGMSASKAFGHDKKWSTFLVFLAFWAISAVMFVILLVFTLVGYGLVGEVLYTILVMPLSAWLYVTICYTYITYGPSNVLSAAGTPGLGVAPPTPTLQPGTQTGASTTNNYCVSCGSPLQSGARFCPRCGKQV